MVDADKGKGKPSEEVNTLQNVVDQFVQKETRYVRLLNAIRKVLLLLLLPSHFSFPLISSDLLSRAKQQNFKQPLLQEPWIKKMGTEEKNLFINIDDIFQLHSDVSSSLFRLSFVS